jgi:hypothetical protein
MEPSHVDTADVERRVVGRRHVSMSETTGLRPATDRGQRSKVLRQGHVEALAGVEGSRQLLVDAFGWLGRALWEYSRPLT